MNELIDKTMKTNELMEHNEDIQTSPSGWGVKPGVFFVKYTIVLPPSGGLSTLTTSDSVTRGSVAQIPATSVPVHPMDCEGALSLSYLTPDRL
jgi:hypothetical protein